MQNVTLKLWSTQHDTVWASIERWDSEHALDGQHKTMLVVGVSSRELQQGDLLELLMLLTSPLEGRLPL